MQPAHIVYHSLILGAVVGSLEILGNPTGLVRSIGTGVADFFRMPYRGLTRGPGAFVVGISSGTSSMVKNITTGRYHKKYKNWDIKIMTIIVLRMEQFGFTVHHCVQEMQME